MKTIADEILELVEGGIINKIRTVLHNEKCPNCGTRIDFKGKVGSKGKNVFHGWQKVGCPKCGWSAVKSGWAEISKLPDGK